MMVEHCNNSPYEALERIRKHHNSLYSCSIKELTFQEMTKLRKINTLLSKYETVMRQEVELLHSYAENRKCSKNDRVIDFEIAIFLYFYLDTSHPTYKRNEDNLLTTLYTSKNSPLDWNFGFGDNRCHNTLYGTTLEHDKHCTVFHALYDHTELTYKETALIGSWVLDIVGYKSKF